MRLLVKFPSRGRRAQFKKVFDIYTRTCDKSTTFLVSLDADDRTMDGIESEFDYQNIVWVRGRSESKIHACNRDLDKVPDWDIVVLASDDMIPQVRDWDKRIIKEMKAHYPDGDGVLHFNDGYMQDRLNTMCILGRKYYDRFGYLYCGEYRSFFSDDEFMDVSRLLGKATYFPDVLFKHEHPANNAMIRNDATYTRNNPLYTYDKNVYNRRKALKFGL